MPGPQRCHLDSPAGSRGEAGVPGPRATMYSHALPATQWVYAVMKALGLLLPPIRERDPEVRRGQVVTATSNRRWASDLTTTWTRLDRLVALVPVIDCGDRVAFDVEVTRSQEAPTVLAPIFTKGKAAYEERK